MKTIWETENDQRKYELWARSCGAAVGLLLTLLAAGAIAKASVGRFAVKSDVTGDVVFDARTSRAWQRASAPGTYDWANAKTYCAGLKLQGSGWRLPDIRELESLVDFKESAPAIDKTVFPGTLGAYYWSATAYKPDASEAWCVTFDYGNSVDYNVGNQGRVRCVR